MKPVFTISSFAGALPERRRVANDERRRNSGLKLADIRRSDRAAHHAEENAKK
jgi:hypothetical protein